MATQRTSSVVSRSSSLEGTPRSEHEHPHRKNIAEAPRAHQLFEHRDGKIVNTSDEVERRPAWTDLLFDLIIVGSFHQLGEVLHDDISERPFSGALMYLVLFLPLITVWQSATFYNNRFGTESWADALLAYVLLIALSGVNLSISVVRTPLGMQCFAGCTLVAYLALLLTFSRTAYWAVGVRGFASSMAVVHGLVAAWWIVPLVHPTLSTFTLTVCSIMSAGTMLWGVRFGMRLYFGAIISRCLNCVYRFVPIDVELAMERFGLLVMVAIGEMVIASASNAVMGDAGFDALKSVGIMVLVSSFAYLTKILYFDLFDGVGEEVRKHAFRFSSFTGLSFMHLHTPLCMGITLSAGVLESITESEDEEEYSLHRRVLTAVGMCLVLNISWLIHLTHDPWPEFSESELVPQWLRTVVNLSVGAVCILLSVLTCSSVSFSFTSLSEIELFFVLLLVMGVAALFEFLCQFVFVLPIPLCTVNFDETALAEHVEALLGEDADEFLKSTADADVNGGATPREADPLSASAASSPPGEDTSYEEEFPVTRARAATRAMRAYLLHETGPRRDLASVAAQNSVLEALQETSLPREFQARTRRNTVHSHPHYGT